MRFLGTPPDGARWSVSLYAKNVANILAFSAVTPSTSAGRLGPQAATLITPRTLGIDVSMRLGGR